MNNHRITSHQQVEISTDIQGRRRNMTGRATPMRRLAASVGAVALTAGGMLAMAPAFADTPENIDPDAGGSIIVHKHEKDSSSTDRNPAGKALEGDTFTVQEVLHGGQSIDLSTAEGTSEARRVGTGGRW